MLSLFSTAISAPAPPKGGRREREREREEREIHSCDILALSLQMRASKSIS